MHRQVLLIIQAWPKGEQNRRKFLCRRGLERDGRHKAAHFGSQVLRNVELRLMISAHLLPGRKSARNINVRLMILWHLLPGRKGKAGNCPALEAAGHRGQKELGK